MDTKIVLLESCLENLKCTVCNGYLSVPPVDVSSSTSICGRCNTGGKRTAAFEELAKFMIFPCFYSNCKEKIAWGNVEQHELQCIHKTILCPNQNCNEIFEITSTLSHFQQYHKENIHQKSFTIIERTAQNNPMNFDLFPAPAVYISNTSVHLVIYNNFYFLVLVHKTVINNSRCNNCHCNTKCSYYDYAFGIFCMNQTNTEHIKYEITLKLYYDCKTTPVSYTKKDMVIPIFNERKHCLKCAYMPDYNRPQAETCSTNHEKARFLNTNFAEVDRRRFTKQSYEINLYSCSENRQNKNNSPNVVSKLSKKLECPICNEYMCPPIYNCQTGHTICKECKPKLPVCPFCKAPLCNSRNFTLEEISETLEVPCYHASVGCQFTGVAESIRDHKRICAFNNFS